MSYKLCYKTFFLHKLHFQPTETSTAKHCTFLLIIYFLWIKWTLLCSIVLIFVSNFSGAVFVRNPLNRELVATFEIIVSVHDNASDIIDMSVSVPNGKKDLSVYLILSVFLYFLFSSVCLLKLFLPFKIILQSFFLFLLLLKELACVLYVGWRVPTSPQL